ncbi:MAG: hypothetical protein ACRDN0_04295 [Trebonia sp.]
MASSKKRKSGKHKTQRQGLSGNPQRRAEQLAEPDRGTLAELAWLMAGGADPAAWWPASHEHIIAGARARTWPSGLADVEALTCELVSDEFYARFTSPDTGLHPAQWLVTLVEKTAAELRSSIQNDSGGSASLSCLLAGLTLIAPPPPPVESDENFKLARERFPDILDPYEVAQAEAGKAAKLLADRGLTAGLLSPSAGASAAGEALVARDAYGSRFLVTAPFGYRDGETDHWYAWDIDHCWVDVVVGAGTFGSAQAALAEWRANVDSAAAGSVLAPCQPPMLATLLNPCLQTGPLSGMLQGTEPRELIREFYRMRRRARALAWPAADSGGDPFDVEPFDGGVAAEAFREWYMARHDSVPPDFAETVGTIVNEWIPGKTVDDRDFYASSPHRIEMTAHLLREGYIAEYANESLAVLPEWTEWCLAQSDPGADFAARALETARAEAAVLVTGGAHSPENPDDRTPFRRRE